MSQPPVPPVTGNGKVLAATAAGSVATIAVYIIDQFLPHPLPPEIVAAVQTLVTSLAVYVVPHGGS